MENKSKVIFGDARKYSFSSDIMLTDPPYDLPGTKLASIIDNYECNHLVLITTISQLISFLSNSNWNICFDFVLDGVAPKKSKSIRQPNYTHQTCVYLKKEKEKSIFDRKRRKRHDVFESNGYWPTIFHAPRNNMHEHGQSKNQDAITDILGSFCANSVIDPFSGSGTVAFAAFELDMDFIIIENDENRFLSLMSAMKFMSMHGVEFHH